jgi:hypothetical protein
VAGMDINALIIVAPRCSRFPLRLLIPVGPHEAPRLHACWTIPKSTAERLVHRRECGLPEPSRKMLTLRTAEEDKHKRSGSWRGLDVFRDLPDLFPRL